MFIMQCWSADGFHVMGWRAFMGKKVLWLQLGQLFALQKDLYYDISDLLEKVMVLQVHTT